MSRRTFTAAELAAVRRRGADALAKSKTTDNGVRWHHRGDAVARLAQLRPAPKGTK